MEITLGRSRRHPQGWKVEVPEPFGVSFADVLEAHTIQGEDDAWWCPFIFVNDYRSKDNWRGGQVVAIDADYYSDVVKPPKGETRHSVPPAALAEALRDAVAAGQVPCTVWHPTPRGARFVFVLDAQVSNHEIMAQTVVGCGALVNEGLIEAGLAATLDAKNKPINGFLADSQTFDLAHFMFTPTALVNGNKRNGVVSPVIDEPFSSEDLAAYLPVARKPQSQFVNTTKVGEIGRALAKLECEGENDGSGVLMKVARKAIQMGISDAETFCSEVAAWNGRRAEPWLKEDLEKRFTDALARWSQEGRVQVATTKDGKPLLSLNSLLEILRGDSLFRNDDGTSKLWYDELKRRIMLGNETLTDNMVTDVRESVGEKYDKTQTIPKEHMRDALVSVAKQQPFHPVEDYFLGLPAWDGEPRLSSMAFEVFGSQETIHTTYLRKWMISAVARMLEPGCQADGALVLVGDQYIGKGSFFKALAVNKDWHTGSEINLEYKLEDAYRITHSVWIYEIEELDKIYNGRGGAGRLKAFMTQRSDTYVEKYEAFAHTYIRRFVFGASANEFDLLRDPSGDRRFWVIGCEGLINYQWVNENVNQLWAEAIFAYFAKEPWHLTHEEDALRHEANALFRPDNVFESKVEDALRAMKYPDQIVSAELLKKTFRGPEGDASKMTFEMKAAYSTVLKRNGYYRSQGRKNGKFMKMWRK